MDEIEYSNGLDENSGRLWKICRALANDLRLELLRLVYTQQGDNCESVLVKMVGVRQPIVSAYLNKLCEAGLIAAERDRIKVYFKPWPRNGRAEELCRDLSFMFRADLADDWRQDIRRIVRAFSHFNRLAILARLMEGPANKAELCRCAGTIVKTLNHHLAIINAAGMLRKRFHGCKGTEIELVRRGEPIVEVLLMYLRSELSDGVALGNFIAERSPDAGASMVLRGIRALEGDDWTNPPPLRPDSIRIDDEIAAALDEPNHE